MSTAVVAFWDISLLRQHSNVSLDGSERGYLQEPKSRRGISLSLRVVVFSFRFLEVVDILEAK